MIVLTRHVKCVELQGGEAVARLVFRRPGRQRAVLVAALILPRPYRDITGSMHDLSIQQRVQGDRDDRYVAEAEVS